MDWTCHTNCTALLLAAQAGHEESVRLLLDHAADPNIADHMGSTPLMEGISRQLVGGSLVNDQSALGCNVSVSGQYVP